MRATLMRRASDFYAAAVPAPLKAEVWLQRLAVEADCLREGIRAKEEATSHGTELECAVTDGLPPVFLRAVFSGTVSG